MLPVWYDEAGQVQYHVPPQLSCLREGEKLLIQQVAVYVPLHHLMYGQIGCRGHIVSFPQNISSVCKTLPRLPSNVSTVRVIKRFKLYKQWRYFQHQFRYSQKGRYGSANLAEEIQ